MNGSTERDYVGTGETLEEAFHDSARQASLAIRAELEAEGLNPDDPEAYRRRKLKNVSIELEVQPENQWVRVYTVINRGSG